jgi:hypothetical protein
LEGWRRGPAPDEFLLRGGERGRQPPSPHRAKAKALENFPGRFSSAADASTPPRTRQSPTQPPQPHSNSHVTLPTNSRSSPIPANESVPLYGRRLLRPGVSTSTTAPFAIDCPAAPLYGRRLLRPGVSTSTNRSVRHRLPGCSLVWAALAPPGLQHEHNCSVRHRLPPRSRYSPFKSAFKLTWLPFKT